MERWSIRVDKSSLSFAAAHFLIFPDGSAERLHGHNYRVAVDLTAALGAAGIVVDFNRVKPLVKELVDSLDQRWLLPDAHPELELGEDDGQVTIRYRERRYSAPAEDVVRLPMNNVSAENLARWLGMALRARFEAEFDDVVVEALEVGVEESPGQRGTWRFEP